MSPFTYPTISTTIQPTKSPTTKPTISINSTSSSTKELVEEFKSVIIASASYLGTASIFLFTFSVFYYLTSALYRVDIRWCNLILLCYSVPVVFAIESVEGNVSCGDTIYDYTEYQYDIDYFQFMLPEPDDADAYSVTISTCGSDLDDTKLWFADVNGTIVNQCDDCESCAYYSYQEEWNMPYLTSGDFFVGVSGYNDYYGSYKLSITCTSVTFPPTHSPTYSTYSPTHLPTHSPTYSTYSPTHLPTHSPTYSTYSPTYSPT
eukprot:484369_1